MNGEYILSKDPYNFNTLEEYIAHHFPELLEEEIKELQNDETLLKKIFTKDEIAGLVEMLCKLNEANAKAVKKQIKDNASKLIEALAE